MVARRWIEMMVLMVACIAAGCTSAWIVYMLFGPVPAPRPPLLVPRILPEGPSATAVTVDDEWIEGPTLAEVARRPERPIVQTILRKPRFVAPRPFDLEERTRLDP
jgi:hypothetical protein